MKNNKIYMTLAHLYNQFKDFVGDSGRSLSEEVNTRIENHKEVIDARKGYSTLKEKIDVIDSAVDGANNISMELGWRVGNAEDNIKTMNDEIETIKVTNPVVQLENGEHLLVSVEQRPTHKSDEFKLNANETYRTNANMDHYVNQLYVRDNIHNKEVDLSFKQNSLFDKTINELRDGSLYAISNGEMRLPTHNVHIVNQEYNNVAIVPGILDIQGVISSPYTNETNHVASAFRSGYTWHVKARMAEVVIRLVKPTHINKVNFTFTSNSDQQSVSVCEFVGSNWVELVKVPSTKKTMDVNKELSVFKIIFNGLTADGNTYLDISDIELIARSYNAHSGLTRVMELVDLYDLSGYATFGPIVDIPNSSICKFAINNTNDSEDSYVYYPSRRLLDSGLFTNTQGMYVVDSIKSSIKQSQILDSVFISSPPTGNEPSLSLSNKSWTEDTTVSFTQGYPVGNLSYCKLYITSQTEAREIPLIPSMLNKITKLDVDGIPVEIELKTVSGCLKIGVKSPKPLVEVKCTMYSLQNIYYSGNGSSIRPSDGSYTTVVQDDYSMLDSVNVSYSCSKAHYYWSNSWPWWGAWVYSSTSYSTYNSSEKYSIVMVDNDNVVSNKRKIKKNTPTTHDENMFIINNACNCTVYVGQNQQAFTAFSNDGRVIPSSQTVSVTPCNEFIGKMKRGLKQKVVKIEPNQVYDRIDDVEYFLSGNNYNFYTYKHDTNSWVITKDGMSAETITRIPSYAFDKLFGGEDIFIKVKINSAKASVNGVQIEFDKGEYKVISNNVIDEYGMNASDLKDIEASFIMNLINEFSTITILSSTISKLPCWQYISPGIEMTEYGGISWAVAGSNIATQHISGNMLIIKNVSNEVKHFKLEQKFFEDQIVQVGDKVQNEAFEEVVAEVEGLKKEIYDATMKVGVLDQNIQILKRAMEEDKNPPADLPTFIIPSQVEIDLQTLPPGGSAEIPGIKSLRYIQYWNTQKDPVPEYVENKCVRELEHQFVYSNGVFTPTYFEMARDYDTDNAYFMSESVSAATTTSFTTADYICTSKRSDNTNQAPYGSKTLDIILTTPENSANWYNNPWTYKQSAFYQLPGEEARWIDIDFEFKEERYIHGILGMDFGFADGAWSSSSNSSGDRNNLSYQKTSILLDLKGDGNWIEHATYTGGFMDLNCYINKPLKKMRIRLEVPYSYNRGEGLVMLKHIDIYYCPTRYVHDVKARIMPILYYSTETWQRLLSAYSDATIYGTSTDIHYLFETNNEIQNNKRYWGFDGSKLVEKQSANYQDGMLLQQFNNLTEEQLRPLLDYKYVRPIAILNSDDGHHSPCIRSMRLNYAEKYTETVSLVNPQDIRTEYDKDRQTVVVTNATGSNKTLKAVIS